MDIAQPENTPVAAPVVEMAFEDAVKQVIRVALAYDGLKKGLHE